MKSNDDIKKIFNKKSKLSAKNIALISSGYTNDVYKIEANKKANYLMKVSKNGYNIYNDESKIYKHYNHSDLIYSDENGIIIKKWIDGKEFNLNENTEKRIIILLKEIDKFHSIKLNSNEFKIFDFSKYAEWLSKKDKMFELYNFVIKKFQNHKLVLNHGDINNKNILLISKNNKEKIKFIDFEWSSINYQWFDVVNYLSEEEIYDENLLKIFVKNLDYINDLSDLYLLMFVRWYYCLAWATHEENLFNINEYKKKAKRNVKFLYSKIIKNKYYIPIQKSIFKW